MHRPLWKSIGILALLLALPALGFAWTAGPPPTSGGFDEEPELGDSIRNRRAGSFHNIPATAINLPSSTQKPSAAPKPLYPPNVARDPKASQAGETGLAAILSFLLPKKEDLDKCFKDQDDHIRNRGRSGLDPFSKQDWK